MLPAQYFSLFFTLSDQAARKVHHSRLAIEAFISSMKCR